MNFESTIIVIQNRIFQVMKETGIKRIKLDDIAIVAKVSKITVSRALSGSEKIKAETRDKILTIAEQMGYFPNTALSKIAKKRRLIGIVNPNMSNPFFSELTKIMTQISSDLDCDTLFFDSYESEETEANAIQRMIQYGIDVLILSIISSDKNYFPTYLETLKKLNIPVILIDREIGNSLYSGIYIDNFYCGTEAANYCNQQPIKDIIVISGPQHSNVATERLRGFSSVINPTKNIQIFYTDFFMDLAFNVTQQYLREKKDSTMFVGINNQISLGILKSCIKSNLTFKKDFDLFSIDQVPYSDIYGFKIPCITHNLYEIAYQAINIAVRSFDNTATQDISKIIVRGKVINLTN